jgi:hypothetical protein
MGSPWWRRGHSEAIELSLREAPANLGINVKNRDEVVPVKRFAFILGALLALAPVLAAAG